MTLRTAANASALAKPNPSALPPVALDAITLLTPAVVSERTGVAVQTLARWRHERIGPCYVKIGSAVRYRVGDLTAWIDSSAVATTGVAA